MRLGYLDAMKAFHIFDGKYFTFAKKDFSKMDIRWADPCAKIFQMDPTVIYSKDSFLNMLPKAVDASQQETDEAWEAFKSIRRIHVRIPDYIQDIKSAAGPRAICRVIAENIKEKGLDSIFMSNAVIALIPEQVAAARFLVKYGII